MMKITTHQPVEVDREFEELELGAFFEYEQGHYPTSCCIKTGADRWLVLGEKATSPFQHWRDSSFGERRITRVFDNVTLNLA